MLNAGFSFSFKYFVAFSFILGIMLTIFVCSMILPPLNHFSDRFLTRAVNLYPPGLEIQITDGTLTVNKNEPIRIPIPYELITDVPPAISDQKQKYLLTIDTKAKTDDYEKSQSLLLLTENQLVAPDEGSGYSVYPFSEVTGVKINKETVDQIIRGAAPFVKALPYLVTAILFIIMAIFLPLSRLFSLLLLTFITMIFAKLLHLKLTYRQLYQLGLHALTVPVLIQVIMTLFSLIPPLPFFNSIVYLLYFLVILAELRKDPKLMSNVS